MIEKISVVITDDHKLFRKGMSALLSDFDFIDEILEAGNGKELVALLDAAEKLPDIVLLDLNMPVMDGVATTPIVRKRFPDLKIIVLSMEDDAQLVGHLVNEGINGYVLKDADPYELELAIKKVVTNDFYFSGSLSEAVIKGYKHRPKSSEQANLPKLTVREQEVLHLICKEHTAVEIGKLLLLSARTVEGYRRKLLAKTGTKNMAGLVIYAIKNNLIKV
jgi:DNA-binding NarL/FixJ family response regulator